MRSNMRPTDLGFEGISQRFQSVVRRSTLWLCCAMFRLPTRLPSGTVASVLRVSGNHRQVTAMSEADAAKAAAAYVSHVSASGTAATVFYGLRVFTTCPTRQMDLNAGLRRQTGRPSLIRSSIKVSQQMCAFPVFEIRNARSFGDHPYSD